MKYRVNTERRLPIILLSIAAALFTSGCSYQPTYSPEDINPAVAIFETKDSIEISPVSGIVSTTGLLFYPGGLVDSHVYDEILSDFSAAAGATAIVAKMPANLAVFDIHAGLKLIKEFPSINRWIIAGHSLGGSMAAATVNKNPDTYEALIFMDSYPADGDSLKDWSGNTLSLYSSIEKVSDAERMEKTLSLIPPATWLTDENRAYPPAVTNYSVIHQIDGGSHSYFGTYGPQRGDFEPTISRTAFHAEAVDYMAEFFQKNK